MTWKRLLWIPVFIVTTWFSIKGAELVYGIVHKESASGLPAPPPLPNPNSQTKQVVDNRPSAEKPSKQPVTTSSQEEKPDVEVKTLIPKQKQADADDGSADVEDKQPLCNPTNPSCFGNSLEDTGENNQSSEEAATPTPVSWFKKFEPDGDIQWAEKMCEQRGSVIGCTLSVRNVGSERHNLSLEDFHVSDQNGNTYAQPCDFTAKFTPGGCHQWLEANDPNGWVDFPITIKNTRSLGPNGGSISITFRYFWAGTHPVAHLVLNVMHEKWN